MQNIDFQDLFGRLPSPHMVLDRDYRFVAANPAYENAVMRDSSELIGRGLFDLFPNAGEGGRRLRESFERVFETGQSDTLAYIPYDIPRPENQGGGVEQRYWTSVHVPLTDSRGEVAYLMQNTVDVTEMVRLRESASLPFRSFPGEVQLIERALEAEEANQSLLSQSADFRRVFQQAPGFIAVLTGAEHIFTFANDAYIRMIGDRHVIGKRVSEALPEIVGQGFFEMLDAVYDSGVARSGEGARIMMQRAPGEAPRETFLDFSYEPIKDEAGTTTGVFVQGMDRTESVRTLRRQRLLLDELNHRVKNTLATVQSIASQTLRSARDLPSAKKDFEARIVALSKAHNLLSARQWADIDLAVLVAQQLSAFGKEQVIASGPSVRLNSKASIAMAMLVHELAMNAARHGSLSSAAGTLFVTWRIVADAAGDKRLELDWKEEGGPHVPAPIHRGFGSRVIDRVVTGELEGVFTADYASDGFSCRIVIPSTSYAQVHDGFVQAAG
jgi:two-component sensor histidine kinase